MNRPLRRVGTVIAAAGALMTGIGLAAPAASAHPLGNATVNHYDGLHLYPDHLTDFAVEDIAEIPTLQRKPLIDTNGDGIIQPAEAAAYAARQCASLAAHDQILVNGHRLTLAVRRAGYSERPGAIQLKIGRLVCQLSSPANLSGASTVAIDDEWDGAGIGWHEITSVGTDVTLHNSPFPATSISDQLLHYPNNLLTSPLDVRSGAITTTPGAGASTYAIGHKIPAAGFALRYLNNLATAFNSTVGAKHVTLGVGLLALVLAVALGAGHAFLPGHGKTIMAAYLVGKRGRLRDVIMVGATVTLTHTAGVIGLGVLITATAGFAPTQAEQDLAILSGLIVAGVGVGLLLSALRRYHQASQSRDLRPALAGAAATIGTVTGTSPAPVLAAESAATASGHVGATIQLHPGPASGAQPHFHPHPHSHAISDPHHQHVHRQQPVPEQNHVHPHRHSTDGSGFSRTGLVGLGVAGGLVPSPSALLVLLAAIALGRTVFGIVLVLGYGLGMAAALTAAGLLLVRLRGRLDRISANRRFAKANRLISVLPILTASLVLLVGIGLTLRAIGGAV